MDTMQAEALRRAQEMHSVKRQHSFGDQQRRNPQNHQNNTTSEKQEAQNPAPHFESERSQSEHSPICAEQKSLPMLFEDKEKLLILVLILILISEEVTDTSVILALLYLII